MPTTTHTPPPYPTYQHAPAPWLGDVPAHWRVLPGKACYYEKKERNTGLQESQVLSLSYGQIVVKPAEQLHGLVPASFETYQIIEPGDIVIRPTDLQNDWNSLRFGLSQHRGIITSAYMCFRTREPLLREYGHLLLHAYDLNKVFYGLGSGLRQNLRWADFKYLPCLVPPPDEQAAIVRYLDAADAQLRQRRDARRRLLALRREERQALIHQTVTQGLRPNAPQRPAGLPYLPAIPAHWEVRRLKNVCRLPYGDSLPDAARLGGDVPVYGSNGQVGNHSFPNTYGQCLVIGRKGSFGKVHYSENPVFAIDTTFFVDSRFTTANIRWLYYMLSSLNLDAVSRDSAVPGLNREEAYKHLCPVPPPDEQAEIVAYLDGEMGRIEAAMARDRRLAELYDEYRLRLMADAVTGRLDVRQAPEPSGLIPMVAQ